MSELEKYKDYKTILAVIAILRCEGKFLLLKRAGDKEVDPDIYSGVGGKVEPGESFLEAIVREVKEETGLTIPSEKFHPSGIVQAPDPNDDAEWVMPIFVCDLDTQEQIPSSEDGDFYWIDLTKIENLNVLPDLADFLKAITKNPNAYVLTYCKYGKDGKVVEKKSVIYANSN